MKRGKDLNKFYRELRQRNSLNMVDRGIFKSYLEPRNNNPGLMTLVNASKGSNTTKMLYSLVNELNKH